MDGMDNENEMVRAGENPAGGTRKPRAPAPEFLAAGARSGNREAKGYRNLPGRPLEQDVVVDGQVFTEPPSPELLERIRSATSMADEPECIGAAIVDAYGKEADYYSRIRHAAEVEQARITRKDLSLEDRIRDVDRRARQGKLNLGHELAICRRDLQRARRGGRSDPASVVRRLERLEERLDGPVDVKCAA